MSALPDSLNVALKEWAVVVDALERGEQILLLRKGGIAEKGGIFRVEHERFLLYQTTEHQKPESVKPEYRARLDAFRREPLTPGEPLRFTSLAEVAEVRAVRDVTALEGLDAEHLWSREQVSFRWTYKPERPLHLLVLRAFRLPAARELPYIRRYGGCRSWVPLDGAVDTSGATPALDDDAFAARRARIIARID